MSDIDDDLEAALDLLAEAIETETQFETAWDKAARALLRKHGRPA